MGQDQIGAAKPLGMIQALKRHEDGIGHHGCGPRDRVGIVLRTDVQERGHLNPGQSVDHLLGPLRRNQRRGQRLGVLLQ